MFHEPACQRSQMFGKSFTPKTLSVGHWIILSVSGFPFRSLFLLRFPRLLDPPGAGVGGENRWSGRVRPVSRVSHTAGWHPLHISWVAPGWADIARICISIQTGLYYSPIYRFCITDHHCASRLLSETFQSTTINAWKLFLTLWDPNMCSHCYLQLVPEKLYYLMINDWKPSGFPCSAISLSLSIATFQFY